MLRTSFRLLALLPSLALAQSHSTVSVPYEYTYLLPSGFNSALDESFVNSTTTGNQTVDSLLQSAAQAPFISYSDEFTALVGSNATINLVQQRENDFAFEVGVWVPERDEVWFASASLQPPARVNVYNMANNSVYPLAASPPVQNPNGGYYYDGQVYFTSFRSNTSDYEGGIIIVDPKTLKSTTLLNSYFGLPFNAPDDIVLINKGNKRYAYFTDLLFLGLVYGSKASPPSLPDGVWRFDFQEKTLHQVITQNDISLPNGVRVSPDFSKLYVCDNGGSGGMNYDPYAGIASMTGSPTIYQYDIDNEGFPVNRKPFATVRDGVADGLHVDDAGRVWSGEASGINVRSPAGRLLGVFNANAFEGTRGTAIANFALAGDTLVIGGGTKLWTVKLAQQVVSRGSALEN